MKYGTRLSIIDEMFLRTHRGTGFPVVLQGLWRTLGAVDAVDLAAVHANLAVGPLARRVVHPSVPGARPRWAPSPHTYPVDYVTDTVTDPLGWADHQGDLELDPTTGPAWRLSAARVVDGTVVSLVCSHALTDARGLISAAALAFTGTASGPRTEIGRSDIADAIGLSGSVLYRSLRASLGLVKKSNRAELRTYTQGDRIIPDPAAASTSVTVTLDTDVWDAVASGSGGSANSLFITAVAGTARRSGLADSGSMAVDVPFGTASGDANSIGMATVRVEQTDSPGDVRRKTKRAFDSPVGAPAGFPAEIVQLVPSRIAAAMTSTPGRGVVLCSNIGDIPASLTHLGPHRASGVATRAIHPHAEGTPTRTRLSAYLSRMDGRYTLSLVGTDRTSTSLSGSLRDELARWELTATDW